MQLKTRRTPGHMFSLARITTSTTTTKRKPRGQYLFRSLLKRRTTKSSFNSLFRYIENISTATIAENGHWFGGRALGHTDTITHSQWGAKMLLSVLFKESFSFSLSSFYNPSLCLRMCVCLQTTSRPFWNVQWNL